MVGWADTAPLFIGVYIFFTKLPWSTSRVVSDSITRITDFDAKGVRSLRRFSTKDAFGTIAKQ